MNVLTPDFTLRRLEDIGGDYTQIFSLNADFVFLLRGLTKIERRRLAKGYIADSGLQYSGIYRCHCQCQLRRSLG